MPVPPIKQSHLPSLTQKAPLCLRTTIHQTSRSHAVQVRTLWWWGRQSSEWPLSSIDENLEDRTRRHQKIMRSRYSKFLRRRAMWEREDHTQWPGHMSDRVWVRRYCGQKPSSRDSQEEKATQEQYGRDSFHKDFEAFKAAVDRAIAKDPYGTLFGRRTASHHWTTNSAWAPFSWLSQRENSGEVESVQPNKSDPGQNEKPTRDNTSGSSINQWETSRSAEKSDAPVEEDYQYDPISMRKVPITRQETAAQPEPESKPFLETLFSEHGVDIPVKTYKPHKVHGYDASTQQPRDDNPEKRQVDFHRGFDSSKRQEMRDLMARSKGNSIDTTGQFTEAASDPKTVEEADKSSVSKDIQEPFEPDENAPLFSGTTYAKRFSNECTTPTASVTSAEAGHRQVMQESVRVTESAMKTSLEKSSTRLEPALHRIQSKPNAKPDEEPFRLQTAVDRHISTSKNEEKKVSRGSDKPDIPESPKATTEEDVDLLRASDVRAATRTARVTRQEAETLKNEASARLDADYASRQPARTNGDGKGPDASADNLTDKLNHVWHHIREYPHGIVAKTMKSVNAFNDNYKKYVRPDGMKDLTNKLIFQDEALSKSPSIYKDAVKQPRLGPFTPSPEVLEAEKEGSERAAALKEATMKAKQEAETQTAQLAQLATDIRGAYEDEYGPINVNHRQPEPVPTKLDQTEPPSSKLHPLATASVRPGVSTNPVIDEHVSNFEPKFAELVDGAKEVRSQLRQTDEELQQLQPSLSSSPDLTMVIDGAKEVRRELHEAHLAIRAIESGRPETVWNAPYKSCSNFGEKRVDWKAGEASADHADRPAVVDNANPAEAAEDRPSSSSGPPAEEPKKVPEPVITPDGSPAWNDEQPPSIENLRKVKFDSQFIILAYDPSKCKVEFSPMNAPEKSNKAADAVGVLSRLKNAPEFLKHFETLKRAGYSLFNGNENMLIFKKKQPENTPGPVPVRKSDEPKANTVTTPASSASATSGTGQWSTMSTSPALEELSAPARSTAKPAASMATPSRPFSNPGQTRVRRQEDVFSGTIRPSASPVDGDDESSPPKPGTNAPTEQDGGIWKRFMRSLKRTMMIVTALGGAAYAIGFIAEGIGAETQKQKGVEDSQAQGPRKRIVMTGQRPGIYSTESSR